MKTLLIALTLVLSGCAGSPLTNTVVSVSMMEDGEKKCAEHGGLRAISPSLIGAAAYCNGKAMFML